MIRRRLGSTGIDTSIVGLGTVKIGRNAGVKYPKTFAIPDDKQVINILNTAAEMGINLLDTAPAYGVSEQRLGQLLPQAAHHDWLLSTKVGEYFDAKTAQSRYDYTQESIRKSVQESCRRLKKDILDIVLIHSDGNDKEIIEQYGALETLSALKKEGLIRASGMSTKTVAGGLLAINQSDVAMVTHNLEYQGELAVIEQAALVNKGILIKKAFASGHISNVTSEENDFIRNSVKKCLSLPAVSSIILGSINPDHIRENVQKAVDVTAKFHS